MSTNTSGASGRSPFREVAPGLFQWSVFQLDRQLDFNGTWIVASRSEPESRDSQLAGNVIIDPPELSALQMEEIWKAGGVAHIVLTNRHHGRRTAELVQRTDAMVHAPRLDAGGLSEVGVRVHRLFGDGDELPAGLRAIGVPDSKSPGETALLLPRDGGTLILGDALIGTPAGSLSLLPDAKFADVARARAGLRVLLAPSLSYVRVLVGDGAMPHDGRAAIAACLGG